MLAINSISLKEMRLVSCVLVMIACEIVSLCFCDLVPHIYCFVLVRKVVRRFSFRYLVASCL